MVLADGLAYERDVSIRSGRRVHEALKAAGASVRMPAADAAAEPYRLTSAWAR
ncbi:MAG: hypothetical protein ACJ73E_08150 [Mycobacteriales bacterium]